MDIQQFIRDLAFTIEESETMAEHVIRSVQTFEEAGMVSGGNGLVIRIVDEDDGSTEVLILTALRGG